MKKQSLLSLLLGSLIIISTHAHAESVCPQVGRTI